MRLEIHRLADIRRKNCLNLAHNIQYFLLKLGSLGNLLVISELYMDIIMHDGRCYDNVIIHFAIFVYEDRETWDSHCISEVWDLGRRQNRDWIQTDGSMNGCVGSESISVIIDGLFLVKPFFWCNGQIGWLTASFVIDFPGYQLDQKIVSGHHIKAQLFFTQFRSFLKSYLYSLYLKKSRAAA